MTAIVSQFVSISCDGPECPNTITFQVPDGEKDALAANPWLRETRNIQTTDGRKFVYCSDVCEIKATGTGVHNQQAIVQPQGPNAAKLAADAAERAKQITQGLKSGGNVTL